MHPGSQVVEMRGGAGRSGEERGGAGRSGEERGGAGRSGERRPHLGLPTTEAGPAEEEAAE